MAIESISKTLGTGSGIDIGALVSQLVEAQFENRSARLAQRSETLTAQISSVSELKSGITGFSAALATLASNGTLATQPTSSNAAIAAVSALPGARIGTLDATLEVRRLAQAQVASTDAFAGGASAEIGTGTLTLAFGTAEVAEGAMTSFTPTGTPIAITIDSAHSTLSGIVQAINAAKAGVTASIVTDGTGARLVVKGATGAAQAFTLEGSGPLAALNIGPAGDAAITGVAQDALLALDGVEVTRATNAVTDLVEGVRIDLASAAPGTQVRLGTTPPTAALTQAVNDFVDTYNQFHAMVQAAVDPVTGPLRGDPGAKDLLRQLRRLSLVELVPGAPEGVPNTLAALGVGTNRDGTLKVDAASLARTLAAYPAEVEALFAPGAGLPKALADVAARATDRETGLGVSEANYAKAQASVADDQADIAVEVERVRTRMTQQFAAMDARVAAYKSTQSFLEQQIAAWNAQD